MTKIHPRYCIPTLVQQKNSLSKSYSTSCDRQLEHQLRLSGNYDLMVGRALLYDAGTVELLASLTNHHLTQNGHLLLVDRGRGCTEHLHELWRVEDLTMAGLT